jgi:gliding motility-associated-like protein
MKTFYNLRAFFSSLKRSTQLAQCLALLAIIACPCSKIFAQAPTISYSSPNTFFLNNAASLAPTSSNVAAPTGAYGSGVVLGSGLTFSQNDVAIDAAGNMYVNEIDASTGVVKKISADGSSTTIIGSGFLTQSACVAVDQSGNVFVADQSVVWKIPASGSPVTYGTPVVINNSFTRPYAIAVDAAGFVYVTDLTVGGVYKMANDGSGKVRVDDGSFSNGAAVTVDAAGNVYVTDDVANKLYEIPVNTSAPVLLATGFGFPRSLAVDAAGTIYVGDENASTIFSVPAGGGTPVALISGLSNLVGLAIDGSYNLYGALQGVTGITKYSPTGGYFISPALPAGLTIDPTSGIISGTPTALSPAANYLVSAYNTNGGGTATVNITVNILPLPAISYSTPQTYTTGTAITPLSPANTGGAVAAPRFNTATVICSGLGDPEGIAMDKAGNIYISDRTGNDIFELAPGSSIPTVFATGFSTIGGIAVDASANVYVADGGGVLKIPAGGGTAVVLESTITPAEVALDPEGNIYFAAGSAGVYKMAPDGTGLTNISSNSSHSISVDLNGNVFFGDAALIYEIPAGGAQKLFYTSSVGVETLTTDATGNVYFSITNGQQLHMVPAGGGTAIPFGPNPANTNALLVDNGFNIYWADFAGTLFKANATGGYFASPELPPGLTIDPTSGIISGTPSAATPATNYTVTAFNTTGPGTATVNITVNPPLPAISYSTPQTYAINTAITPLSPASTGGAVGALGFNTTAVTLCSGLGDPEGLAMDKAGNIYISDRTHNEIFELAPGSSIPTVFATGFSTIGGLAVDASANVYVADATAGKLLKIPAGGGTAVTLESTITPADVALDPAGNIYFSAGTAGVYKMAPDGTGLTNISSTSSRFLSVDLNGNVFFGTAALIYEIPAGGAQKLFYTYSLAVEALTTDATGNVYFSIKNGQQMHMVPAGGGTAIPFGPNTAFTNALLVDNGFNIYWGGTGATLLKANATGGYFASPELPPGLTIDPTSGIISGTPTAASPVTNYTVTAFNTAGPGTATVNITVDGLPPVISYGASQTYTAGTAITPLAPSSTGAAVSVPAYYGTLTTVSSGFGSPSGVAMDASGNIYVADKNNNDIIKIPAGGGSPTTITANLNSPLGIAVDKLGNIYVADSQNGVVKEISADLSTVTQVGSGFIIPVAVALDPSGNIFVADANPGNNAIYEIATPTGKQSTFASGLFTDISGLATDASGNLYATDESTGTLFKFTSRSNLSLTFASMFNFPTGVAVGPSGDIFVSTGNGAQVYEIPMGSGAPVAIGSGFAFPAGVVIDGAGNVYASDAGPNVLYKVTPSGGYYINQALPRGLKLNDTTGIISGTPKVVSAATNYTVTAYASGTPGTATINITVNAAQVPAIAYSGPQTYTAGTAITPLSPTNTGGPVASIGYSDNLVVPGSGFSSPMGTAVDSHGNVYVADNLNNLVKEIPAGGGTPVSIGGASFSSPAAVAVDSTGNVYVADEGNKQIVEIPAGGGGNVILGSGFTAPNGVAIDPSGNVFVTDESTETVYEIPAGNLTPVTISSGFTLLTGIAVDASDNIYVADGGNSAVYKLRLTGGTPSPIGTFFDYPTGVAVDAAGNVYVADQGPNVVYRIPADGSGQFTIISELNNPQGISVDPYGNVYIADTGNNAVEELSPAGGYFINRPLPAGISMSSLTGTISGTPTAASAATNYLISAYNTGGMSQASLNITVNIPPPPVISYATPLAYNLGVAIAPFSPTSTGVDVPAYNTAIGSIGSGFNFPYGVAIDKKGDIFVADAGNAAVWEYPAGGGPKLSIGSGFTGPVGVAVDTTGNVYVADGSASNVVKVPVGGGSQVLLGTGYNFPNGIAVDAGGNVYVSDAGLGEVFEIAAGQTSNTVFASGFSYPGGVAIDNAGNIYIADQGSGAPSALYEFAAGTSTKTAIAYNFNLLTGVATDFSGNLFAADGGVGKIIEFPAGGGTTVTIGGLSIPYGMAADSVGNLYAGDIGTNHVDKIAPSGGYYISAVLPAGLSFNSTTGTITGTATASSRRKNYTVSAYNAGGMATAAFNVVSNVATLDSLVRDTGKLTPSTFSSSVTSYTDSVSHSTVSVSLKAYPTDPNAKVTINGTAVAAGTAFSVPLIVGNNTAAVVVTAQDGVTTDTYTMTIVRPSTDATLSALTLSSGTLTPTFASGTTSYTASVASTTASITVTPTTNNASATVTVNSTTVTSGTASGAITLNPGANTITVVGTAQDGVTTDTYTITVTQLPPVPTVTYSGGGTETYTTGTAITPLTAGGSGTATPAYGSPTTFGSGFSSTIGVFADRAGNVYAADAGNNAVDEIPAGGGSPTAIGSGFSGPLGVTVDHAGNVYVADAGNSAVKKIPVGGGTLVSIGGTFSHPVSVSVDVAGDVYVVDSNTHLVYKIPAGGGNAVTFSSAFANPTGVAADAAGTVYVVDKSTGDAYKIPFGGSPAVIGTGFSNPTGIAVDQAYNVFVSDATANTVTEIPADGSSNVTASGFITAGSVAVDGAGIIYVGDGGSSTVKEAKPAGGYFITPALPLGLVLSASTGTISGTPLLAKPATNYTITGYNTGGGGTTVENITVISNNPNLMALNINGTLTPGFAPGTTSYTASVGNAVTSINVNPIPRDPASTVKVNGTLVTTGSVAVPLSAGSNTITTIVTASDGTTTKTYTITVTRAPSTNAYLLYLSAQRAALSPSFAYKTFAYTSSVPNSTSSVAVIPSVLDLTATVKVNNTLVANKTASGPIPLAVGSNTITVLVTAQDNTTTQTYTITVTRAAGGVDSFDPGISVTKPTEAVTLADDGIMVHQGVSPNGDGINDFLQIDNITQYPDNKLSIMNRNGQLVYETQGYDNTSKVFDGHSNKNGQMQQPGTYFYQLDYTVNGITKHKTGFLVLKY